MFKLLILILSCSYTLCILNINNASPIFPTLLKLNGGATSPSSSTTEENKDENIRDVVIVGSGPSGLTAAIYTARAMLNPLMIAGYNAGGQLMLTSDVENFPGYRTAITGNL